MNVLRLAVMMGYILFNSYTHGQYEQSSKTIGVTSTNIKNDNYQNSNVDKSTELHMPVAILKQINRHNQDGSYTYGFEGADGSFKIETKSATGEVKGKYGFVDDTGKVRIVEYGANQLGFQPAGEGITVAPPTLIDETTNSIQRISGVESKNLESFESSDVSLPIEKSHPQRPISLSYAPASMNSKQLEFSQEFDFQERLPASQVYNQGPVQFDPPSNLQLQYSMMSVNSTATPSDKSQPRVGVLDQLARDYALPNNAALPLHDISFGYY